MLSDILICIQISAFTLHPNSFHKVSVSVHLISQWRWLLNFIYLNILNFHYLELVFLTPPMQILLIYSQMEYHILKETFAAVSDQVIWFPKLLLFPSRHPSEWSFKIY